jgi:hypothetical protein
VTWFVGGAIVAGCGWWSLMPQVARDMVSTSINLKATDSNETAASTVEEEIDPQVFTVKLWNPSPPPPPATPAPETLAAKPELAKPLRLQLIGIITEGSGSDGGTHRAAVYDPDTDRLLIVASGDRIAEHTITEVTSNTVELSDGRNTRTLSLKEDHS